MLVRVLTDAGGPKPVGLIAHVVEEREQDYVIRFLARTDESDRGRTVYQYEDETYVVDDDYIIEYYDDEMDAGFTRVDAGWVKGSADADYDPDASDDDEGDGSEDEAGDEENEEDEEYFDEDDDEYDGDGDDD